MISDFDMGVQNFVDLEKKYGRQKIKQRIWAAQPGKSHACCRTLH